MVFSKFRTILIAAALLSPACTFAEETLWPSLTGEEPAGAKAGQQAQRQEQPKPEKALDAATPAPRAAAKPLVRPTSKPAPRPAPSVVAANGFAARPADTTGKRPLVIIRFDRANVPYQQALYSAIGRVLERRPNAVFDLVAVAPSAGGPARVALNTNKSRRFADGVLRSLMDMGLPPGRVAVSGKTSPTARTNEVHLYLR